MINQLLLPELDMEVAKCRKVLERIPAELYSYQPHEKSMSLGMLAGHIAEMLQWGAATINSESIDINPPESSTKWEPFIPQNGAQLLAKLDESAQVFRSALEGASDEALMAPWTLLNGGQPLFTMPRFACLRSMILNHVIHHRGQISVYLRLNNIPVPAIYGPSADEAE